MIQSINGYLSGERLSLDLHVFGPETHMTAIVGAALGVRPMPEATVEPHATGRFLLQPERNVSDGGLMEQIRDYCVFFRGVAVVTDYSKKMPSTVASRPPMLLDAPLLLVDRSRVNEARAGICVCLIWLMPEYLLIRSPNSRSISIHFTQFIALFNRREIVWNERRLPGDGTLCNPEIKVFEYSETSLIHVQKCICGC